MQSSSFYCVQLFFSFQVNNDLEVSRSPLRPPHVDPSSEDGSLLGLERLREVEDGLLPVGGRDVRSRGEEHVAFGQVEERVEVAGQRSHATVSGHLTKGEQTLTCSN